MNVVYAVGSTGKIVYDIHKSLIDKGYESIVLYGRKKVKSGMCIKPQPKWRLYTML